MPRLFIGIPLPDSYHDKSAAVAEELQTRMKSRVSWTPDGNAHVTLLFLGDVAEPDVPRIKEQLAAVDFPAFHIRAGGCSAFPDENHPRVIYAGIMKGATHCEALAAAVTQAMAPIGFEREKQPFVSHITLGRVKHRKREDWPAIFKSANTPWPGFKVDRFTLWESTLTPMGAIYSPLQEFPLKTD